MQIDALAKISSWHELVLILATIANFSLQSFELREAQSDNFSN